MKTPFISVVIPVFNRSLDLERALDSLINQTEMNFEVIVVDDGSSENIKLTTDKYASCLDLKLIRIENSGGPARPRNVGVRASKGYWISFLDSDDWWSSTRIAEVSASINKNPGYDIFYHKLKVVSHDRYVRWWSTTSLGFQLSGAVFVDLMTKGNALPNSSVVLRRLCFQEFGYLNESIEFASVEDFDYWLELARKQCKFYFINKSLGFYWLSTTGISSNAETAVSRNKLVLKKYISFLDEENRQRAISKFYYFAGSVLYSAGDFNRARCYLYDAKRLVGFWLNVKRLFKLCRIHMGLN